MVVGSALSLSTLNRFLAAHHIGSSIDIFIVDHSSEKLVASSKGIHDVVVHDSDHRERQLHWNESQNEAVLMSLGTLVERHGSLAEAPAKNGDALVYDSTLKFAFTHQALHMKGHRASQHLNWTIVFVRNVEAFKQAMSVVDHQITLERDEIDRITHDTLHQQTAKTLIMCIGFTLLGAIVMGCVSRAVTRPLKLISAYMRSVSKFETTLGGYSWLLRQKWKFNQRSKIVSAAL